MNDDDGLHVAEVDFAIEVWWKVWCPNPPCGKVNWFCDGDPTDMTQADHAGLRCHACGHRWVAPMVAQVVRMSGDVVTCTEGRPSP